jgi:hypothetical protein
MKLRRPSPALVISCIALVVACTGTAVAATVITRSSQVKNNTLLSADIKDGSLQGRDIKNGTITVNKLKSGATTGSSAGGGGVTAFQALRKQGPENQPAGVGIKVASLTVPAGSYMVTASTVMTSLPGPQNPLLPERSSPEGRCRLDLAGDASESFQNVLVESKTAPSTLYMQGTRTVAEPAEFSLTCGAGSPFRLSETSIIATTVGTIVPTAIP